MSPTNWPNKDPSSILPPHRQGVGKLIFLTLFSIFLCFVGPLVVFAPIPLALAIILYGKSRASMAMALATILLLTFSAQGNSSYYLGGVFFLTYIFSFLVGEIILRKSSPIWGLLSSGITFLAIILALLGMYAIFSSEGISADLSKALEEQFATIKAKNAKFIEQNQEKNKFLTDLLEKPQQVAQTILHWFPTLLVIFVFGGLWICLGAILKFSHLWRGQCSYPYTIKNFLSFTMPMGSVWFLLGGLILYLWGEHLADILAIVGGNALYCLGLFYFFHGVGIFSDFLDHLRVFGIFRVLFVVTVIVMGMNVLALVGIFDMWFNFRKFFNREKGEQE